MATKAKYYNIGLLCYLIFLLLPTTLYAFNVKNIPPKNPYFVGRETYLDNIQKKLSKYHIVYLTGYGGVGKSQLVKEYSHINSQKYDLIWWFDLKNELEMQYESLLTHMSNSKGFKNLVNIDINNIAPSVLIDFTNTLFADCNCKWLLIFDNASSTNNLKLPKPKNSGQHIIITTREKRVFGDNILTLGPFTNKESENFLFKVHPKAQKEEITKLYKTLYNYPLALAQVSEEILMYGTDINSYLQKLNGPNINKIPMRSYVTQEYNNNYHEILNLTLQAIEQKDKEAAKVLYMLALLNVDLPKELLKNLFGDDIEEKAMILSKYGVIIQYENSQFLNIHDIIRDEAIKRLNNADIKYKQEVIHTLAKYFNKFYSEKNFQYLSSLDATNSCKIALYAFIDVALDNNIIDEEILNIILISFKLNHTLFNRHIDYALYQRLANKVYSKKIVNVPTVKKALLYVNLIFADSLYESYEQLSKFEQEMLFLAKLSEAQKSHAELFSIYNLIGQFYLFLGDINEAKIYIEKAKDKISYNSNIFDLLQHWYTSAWLYYEMRDINSGMNALNNYVKLNEQLSSRVSGRLVAKSLEIEFMNLVDQKDDTKKELEKTLKDAKKYYNNIPSSVVGKLELTKALMHFQDGLYDLAQHQCKRALKTIKQALGADMLTLTQAHIHLILGEIHEKHGNHPLALQEYKKVLAFYNKMSYGRTMSLYEYGELLANLTSIYYKLKNLPESKIYYQKLVSNFGLDHVIIEKLIKELPLDYISQLDNIDKK